MLSHFDRDHISGMVYLLSKFKVGTLVLPYLPLWQRMAVAFIERLDSHQRLFQFFVDPVQYIAGLEGTDVEEIILVPGSTGEVSGSDEGEGLPSFPEGHAPLELTIDRTETLDGDQRADFNSFKSSEAVKKLNFLRAGGSISLSRFWEFVPYNDPQVNPAPTARFRRLVSSRRADLLGAARGTARKRVLAALKDAYDRYFGASARARNEITLFMYSGPIGISPKRWVHWHHEIVVRKCRVPVRQKMFCWQYIEACDCSTGLLYTGDGYLNTKSHLDRLTGYLGWRRIERILCLQVMHHGAEGNWHRGVAAALSPCLSVFSSDPDHKGFGATHMPPWFVIFCLTTLSRWIRRHPWNVKAFIIIGSDLA